MFERCMKGSWMMISTHNTLSVKLIVTTTVGRPNLSNYHQCAIVLSNTSYTTFPIFNVHVLQLCILLVRICFSRFLIQIQSVTILSIVFFQKNKSGFGRQNKGRSQSKSPNMPHATKKKDQNKTTIWTFFFFYCTLQNA